MLGFFFWINVLFLPINVLLMGRKSNLNFKKVVKIPIGRKHFFWNHERNNELPTYKSTLCFILSWIFKVLWWDFFWIKVLFLPINVLLMGKKTNFNFKKVVKIPKGRRHFFWNHERNKELPTYKSTLCSILSWIF